MAAPDEAELRAPRVILADDHQPIHGLIRRIIEPEFKLIGTVVNGRDLVAAALDLSPDALIVDVEMPILSGIQAVAQIFASVPKPKMAAVFLTSENDPHLVDRALRAGGLGYVLKPLADRHLTHALREALDGRVFLCPKVSRHT